MKIEEIKSEPLLKEFSIVLPSDFIDSIYNDKIKDIASRVVVEGFRKGKAPVSIVQKKYGDKVYREVLEEQVDKSCRDAIKDLNVFGSPNLKNFDGKKGQDVSFNLSVELYPEVKFPDFKSIKLTNPVMDLSDGDFKKEKDVLLSNLFSRGIITEDSSNEKSDILCTVEIRGANNDLINKEPLNAMISFNNESIKDISLISDELAKQHFIGIRAGDSIDFEFKMPETDSKAYNFYSDQHLQKFAGEKVYGQFKVVNVATTSPNYDNLEQIAQVLGCKVEEIDEKVRKFIQNNFDLKAFDFKKIELFDVFEKELKFDVPQTILKSESKGLLEQIMQVRNSEDELKSKTDAELLEYANRYALRRIRVGMLLSKYSEINKISVTQDEFRAAVMRQAMNNPNISDQIIRIYTSNSDLRERLMGSILEDKSITAIISEVESVDKKYTPKALEEELENLSNKHFM